MKARVIALGLIAAVALLAGACTAAAAPQQQKIAVSYDDFAQQKQITKQVTIPRGTELTVQLGSNPTTGFSWGEAAIANPAVVQQNDSRYIAPTGGAIGSGGTQEWTFTALARGTTAVTMQYSRPWQGGEKAEWTFEITVTVQ